jgi:hypothetical protein
MSELDQASADTALRLPGWAARYLGISAGSLAKLRCTPDGPRYIKMAHITRYRQCDLDAWIAGRIVASTAQTRGHPYKTPVIPPVRRAKKPAVESTTA